MRTRHDKVFRPTKHVITPEKIKRSQSALKRERDKHPLFADQLVEIQETPEERLISFFDKLRRHEKQIRKAFAVAWKVGRAALAGMSHVDRATCLDSWNHSSTPATGEFFADHCCRFAGRQQLAKASSSTQTNG